MLISAQQGAAQPSADTDVDILNFALNLEYLDAEFYNIITTGSTLNQLGIDISGSGVIGLSTGVQQLSFPDASTLRLAKEIAWDELAHVQLLRSIILDLGGTPVARPAMNYNALGFSPASLIDALQLAHVFEDTAVSAYAGAIASIQDKTALSTVGRILAMEAEHAGAIRLVLSLTGAVTRMADGADISLPPVGPIFSANNRGLAEIRTPEEVLYVAYGGSANASSGGFFPNGVNGTIKTSAAVPAAYAGDTLAASPNPAPPVSGSPYGQITLTWNAPSARVIEIRINSPDGPLLVHDVSTGSISTGPWVSNGMKFYLQDVSYGNPPAPANTLAVVTVSVPPGF